MGELNKKWFQTVWTCLLFVSVMINQIQRWVDAAWAHSEAMNVFNDVLMWITLPLTILLFVWHCIDYWRQSERLFWRKWRQWSGAIAVGIALAAVLVLLIRYAKGEKAIIDEEDRVILLGVFAAAGLVWAVARFKFKHWRKDE